MSNLPTNPLQALIAQAAKAEAPTSTVEQARRRVEGATDAVVILADVSGSMQEQARGNQRKVDLLREALVNLRPDLPAANVYAFSGGGIRMVPLEGDLPEPKGSTPLDDALDQAAGHRPRLTLVISDGHPDDETAALRAADALTGRIDVIYCGPETDTEGLAFMRRLVRDSGGRVVRHDFGQAALAPTMRRMLALPERTDR